MKNDIFSFSRFGRYFAGELASICSGKGLSILAFGLMPVYIFILDLLFSSFGDGYEYMYAISRNTFFVFSFWIFAIWIPSACYGNITDKRAGAVYTLIPVSSLEKTLSMIISTLIVIPLAFCIIWTGTDFLITMAVGSPVKDTMLVYAFSESFTPLDLDFSDMLVSAANAILFFLLGAVFFRKHKIAKTILVWMGIGIVLVLLGMTVLETMTDNWQSAASLENVDISTLNIVWSCTIAAILGIAIFLRIKTIQY